MNSLKSVEVAVRYEMRRQAAVLDNGGRVHQETRHFNEDGYTSPGRSKETAQDYRYFPEPDLEPIAPDADFVEKVSRLVGQHDVSTVSISRGRDGVSRSTSFRLDPVLPPDRIRALPDDRTRP